MDDVFKALGDPVRVAIVDTLAARGDQSLFELCARLVATNDVTMSRQAVSKHLGVLESAGIVRMTRSGRTTLHSLEPGVLRDARDWLTTHIQQ